MSACAAAMKSITARGRWIVGVAEPERARDPWALRVASLGRYDDARRIEVAPASPLAELLGVDAHDLAAPGAVEALAGVGWVEAEGLAWKLPQPSEPRALLVGLPARGPVALYGPRAFEHAAGARLARACGLGELDVLLGTFETMYADDPAVSLRGRHVVVFDAEAAAMLDADERRAAASFAVIERDAPRGIASALMLRATLAARRLAHAATSDSAEAEAVVVASAATGFAAARAVEMRLMQRAWSLAVQAGVAWPAARPGAGWTLTAGPMPRNLARDFSGVRAEVSGPPWRATAAGPAGRVAQDCTDLEGALLVAERLARTLGGLAPWERRDIELAAASCLQDQARGDA